MPEVSWKCAETINQIKSAANSCLTKERWLIRECEGITKLQLRNFLKTKISAYILMLK